MHPLETLHRTLRLAGVLLDSAADQIRDASLSPVRDNILKIGTVLAEISELRLEVHKAAPELKLEAQYERPSPEGSEANRRLGEVLLIADDLATKGSLTEAIAVLKNFAQSEPSAPHCEIARTQADNYRQRAEP